jgi:hypothetical protein
MTRLAGARRARCAGRKLPPSRLVRPCASHVCGARPFSGDVEAREVRNGQAPNVCSREVGRSLNDPSATFEPSDSSPQSGCRRSTVTGYVDEPIGQDQREKHENPCENKPATCRHLRLTFRPKQKGPKKKVVHEFGRLTFCRPAPEPPDREQASSSEGHGKKQGSISVHRVCIDDSTRLGPLGYLGEDEADESGAAGEIVKRPTLESPSSCAI